MIDFKYDLFVELVHFVERSPISKREYQEESLARPHVLLPHGAKLLLAGGVEDVQLGHGVIDNALLGVGVLNGGVIVRHKVALEGNKLLKVSLLVKVLTRDI